MDSLEAGRPDKKRFLSHLFPNRGKRADKRKEVLGSGGEREAWLNLQFDKIQRRIAILKDEWKIYISYFTEGTSFFCLCGLAGEGRDSSLEQ